MRNTCATCRKSGYKPYHCNAKKYLLCKHSDRSPTTFANDGKKYPHTTKEKSYWVGRPHKGNSKIRSSKRSAVKTAFMPLNSREFFAKLSMTLKGTALNLSKFASYLDKVNKCSRTR